MNLPNTKAEINTHTNTRYDFPDETDQYIKTTLEELGIQNLLDMKNQTFIYGAYLHYIMKHNSV